VKTNKKVGLAICFDHTEMIHVYSEKTDIWALLYPIAWVDGSALEVWFHESLPQKLVEEGFIFHIYLSYFSLFYFSQNHFSLSHFSFYIYKT